MHIGIIGSGNMARVLGRKWHEAGHQVMVSSRDASKAAELARQIGGTASGSFQDAADFGEVILLAVHWTGAIDAMRGLRVPATTILIDCNNPVEYKNWSLTIGFDDSYAEQIAKAVPQARVVKAFNTIFRQIFEYPEPQINGVRTTVFIAGDDADAKQVVAGLANDIGCEPVDCGALQISRLLEPVAALIIRLGWVEKLGPHMSIDLVRAAIGTDGAPLSPQP